MITKTGSELMSKEAFFFNAAAKGIGTVGRFIGNKALTYGRGMLQSGRKATLSNPSAGTMRMNYGQKAIDFGRGLGTRSKSFKSLGVNLDTKLENAAKSAGDSLKGAMSNLKNKK